MKNTEILKRIKEHKIKLIMITITLAIVAIGGLSIYYLNAKDTEESIIQEEVLSNDTEKPEEEEIKETEKVETVETVNEDIDTNKQEEKKQDENVQKVQDKEPVKQEIPKTNTKVSNDKPVEKKVQEETKKQQVQNNPITYRNEKLGIAFDMPASWKDSYVVKDNGNEIVVYMKHKDNFENGAGFLFLISSDIESQDGGEFLDSVGVPKRSKIGNKEFIIGGPRDFPMYENDPLFEKFKTMSREKCKVVSTLRAI